MEITVIRPEECPERFFRITSGDKTVYCRGNDAVSLPCEDGRFTVATAEKRDYLNFRIKKRILRVLHIGVTAVLSVPFRIIAMFTDAYSGSYALGEFTAYSDCDPFVTEREFEVQNTGETVTLRFSASRLLFFCRRTLKAISPVQEEKLYSAQKASDHTG